MERDAVEDLPSHARRSSMTFLDRVFSGARAIGAFARASALLREVEEELKEELLDVGDKPKALRFPHLELAPEAYWEHNFFSILLVSIFQAIGIDDARVRDYAAIIHTVRGIVTAADNIQDDEAKGALLVEFRAGRVLPNVFSILLQAGSLHERLRNVTGSDAAGLQAWGALIDLLYAIGDEESGEESAVEEVLHPKRLLDEIHRFRGANLLLLAFVVPELNESEHAEAIANAKAGIFRIGLALQILDDLADFEEDLQRRNHNVLRSWLVHGCGTDGRGGPGVAVPDARLSTYTPTELAAPQELFPQATGEVTVMAIEFALSGFDRLRLAGYPLDGHRARVDVRDVSASGATTSVGMLFGFLEASRCRDNRAVLRGCIGIHASERRGKRHRESKSMRSPSSTQLVADRPDAVRYRVERLIGHGVYEQRGVPTCGTAGARTPHHIVKR